MKCLAANTANKILSVALTDDDTLLHYYETAETRDQGNLLLQHIGRALETNNLTYADIDLLGAVTGPGSFTGIRIGLAAMRGIALAAEKPLIGMTSFDLFAVHGVLNVIAVESWREELYFEVRDASGKVIIPPVNETPENFTKRLSGFKGIVISGDAAEKMKNFLPEATVHTLTAGAGDAARIALARFAESGRTPEKPLPFYLREADVTLSAQIRKIETK